MPTQNNIRARLDKNGMTAKTLATWLLDANEVIMCYIEQGRALPTKDDLSAMTELLDCETAELYPFLDDIDLAGTQARISKIKAPDIHPGDHGHEGMERVYIWYPADGKEALFEVIKQLDYPSVAEWFRDMARITFLKAAKLDGKMLHEAAKEETK
jgi:hypothetical protein